MKTFATLAALAVSASAYVAEENIDVVVVQESYMETFNVLEDAEYAVAMEQGSGRDHTDWSWWFESEGAKAEVIAAHEDVVDAELGLDVAVAEYDYVLHQTLSPQVEHQRNCQLHREEEMNLYYQCTQSDINNYALHHFGGEQRSYPRWVQEYNVCIDHIHSAKLLHLDYYHEDGTVTLEPCNPQTHTNSVYIGNNDVIIAHEFTGIISAKPLNPMESCSKQQIPDLGGMWLQVSSLNSYHEVLMGNQKVNEDDVVCHQVRPSWMMGPATIVTAGTKETSTVSVNLHSTNEYVDDGCKLELNAGVDENKHQYLSTVGDNLGMGKQVGLETYSVDSEGVEHHQNTEIHIRVGGCTLKADDSGIATRTYINGIRLM